MIIGEYTKKRINLIIEEFGINDEAQDAAEKLSSLIIDVIKNKHGHKFVFPFCGVDIKIFISTREDYNASWFEDLKWMSVTVPETKKGYDVASLTNILGHELEHAYQNIKMGKGFGNQQLYNIARKNLNSKNIYAANFADIIYGCTRSEQDAMINAAYTELKTKNGDDIPDNIIKSSDAFLWLQRLYKAKHFIKIHKDDEEMTMSLKEYTNVNPRYDLKKMMRVLNRGIKDFEWKIARLVNGYKKKFMMEHNVSINTRRKENNNYIEYLL